MKKVLKLSEINIKYEELFNLSDKIGSIHQDFSNTLVENDNNGKAAYYDESVRQLLDLNSTYGAAEEFSDSIPKTLETLIKNTSAFFRNIAEEEKEKDTRIANKIRR